MERGARLPLVVIGLLIVLIGTSVMNTCAVDRLERQVIRVAKDVERLDVSGGAGVSEVGEPGQASSVTATGWGGRRVAVRFVEGAAAGAPLRLGDKPRPQADTYVFRRLEPPRTLSVTTTPEADADLVSRFALDRLVEVDPEAPPGVLPALATRWETSADGLTTTFHLRRGVQFADGRPFTSADVRFTFDVIRDPAVRADHLRAGIEAVASVETPDDSTVIVHARRPYWKALYTFGQSLRVLNRAWYREQIPAFAARLGVERFALEPGEPGFAEVFNAIAVPCPGTGPYYFEGDAYDPSQPVELVQNPFYWGTQVHPERFNLRRLRWVYISDNVAAIEAVRRGQIDHMRVDFQSWDDDYSHDPTITRRAAWYEYDHLGLGYSFILWNARRPPFDDARVRRAMTHLLDREWVLREVERGRGRVATCPDKPSYPSYPDAAPIPYDLDAARRLLAEAGWRDTDGDGVLDRDGQPFEFELELGSAQRFYTQVAAQLADAARQVGVRVRYQHVEWASFIEDLGARRFDAMSLYYSFDDPWIDPYDDFHSSQDVPGGGNLSGWHSPRADRLMETMRGTRDAAERDALMREFCGVFQDEQPMTLLTHALVGMLVSRRFQGVEVLPTGLSIRDAWVRPEDTRYR